MAEAITLTDALEREHHEIDAGLEAFGEALARGRVAAEAFGPAADALRRHIYLEEEHLFPPLRARGLFGPITVMIREHADIWPLLDVIEAGIADGAPAEAMGETFRQLTSLLEEHNFKEERIVYPSADQSLPEAEAAEMHTLIEDASMPEGWRCQGLPAA